MAKEDEHKNADESDDNRAEEETSEDAEEKESASEADKDDAADEESAAEAETATKEEEEEAPRAATRNRSRLRRAPPPPPPPASSLGKSLGMFILVLLVLGGGFYWLGQSEAGLTSNQPKWKVGQEVTVEITLVKEDATNLACASTSTFTGKKCEFASKTEKNAGLEEKNMYKPYTSTDGVQFAAAGLWSEPAMDKAKLPADRFAVSCKYKVEGMLAGPFIRWNPTAPWNEKGADWYAGTVSGCALVK